MNITLATLPTATAQQVFDQIVTHLRQQNEAAVVNGNCAYHYNGLMCAAGCLISDEEYKAEWENKSWTHLTYSGWVPDTHKWLIDGMQTVHDETPVTHWEDGFKRVALEHQLEYRAP